MNPTNPTRRPWLVDTVLFADPPERSLVVRRQLPFFVAVLLMYGAIGLLDSVGPNATLLHVALVANAVLLGVCATVPWERLPPAASLAVPVLDFLLVGLLRAGADIELSVAAGLTIFPVIWLAVSERMPRTAVLLGTLLTLAVMWAGHRASGNEMTADFRTDLVVIPLMMMGVGFTVQAVAGRLRRQEAQLRRVVTESARRQRLLDAVLDTVEVGIVAFDTDGLITLMNREQGRFYELARPERGSEGVAEDLLVYADAVGTRLPVPDRPGARVLRGEAFSGQLVWVGPVPDQRVVSVSARPMRDEHGRTEGAVLSFNDVTDLVAALQAKDEFLAGVSHELRTPLTSIRGYTELLSMAGDLPEDTRTGLEVIGRNAEQLSTLIDDLLGTPTVSADLRLVSTDLMEVVQQSVAAAGVRAAEAGVDLHADAPRRLVVNCDPVRIGQVLDNLLSNAIKYSTGGGAVTVRVTRSSDHALCRVIDRGLGIGSEDARRVFDRFFRSQDARASAIPGLGLGLTIAQKIVEQHGGTLTCESAAGSGTTFTIALPLGGPPRAPEPATGEHRAVEHSRASTARTS